MASHLPGQSYASGREITHSSAYKDGHSCLQFCRMGLPYNSTCTFLAGSCMALCKNLLVLVLPNSAGSVCSLLWLE